MTHNDAGFIYVLVTMVALLLFAVAAVFAFRTRPEPVKPPEPIIGHITEVRQSEQGIIVTGQLTDEGLKTFPGDTIIWQSLSLQFDEDGTTGTLAVVRDDAKPCKGLNGNVCVAEGCYGEACIK